MSRRKKYPNYNELYPEASSEVISFLKKSDRKIVYQSYDLKVDKLLVNQEAQTAVFIASREDSIDRLIETNAQFSDKVPSVEDIVVGKLMTEQLYECLALLSEQEQELITALFFNDVSEVAMALQLGINQSNVSRRKDKILNKLKKLLER